MLKTFLKISLKEKILSKDLWINKMIFLEGFLERKKKKTNKKVIKIKKIKKTIFLEGLVIFRILEISRILEDFKTKDLKMILDQENFIVNLHVLVQVQMELEKEYQQKLQQLLKMVIKLEKLKKHKFYLMVKKK